MNADVTAPLQPGSTIGILGGGQLGRMLAMSAAQLGFRCHVYSDVPGPALDVAHSSTIGAFDDLARIADFARSVDVVTYEFENVPLRAAAAAQEIAPVRPGPKALDVAQDRLTEKTFISKLGIPVAPFAAVGNLSELQAAAERVGLPAILKTRRLGYDGKGQVRLESADALAGAIDEIRGAPAVLEGFVAFQYEVSVLVVRAVDGAIRVYDPPINTHRNGILDTSVVPSPLPAAHRKHAEEIASRIALALDYVGVLAVEMFFLGETGGASLVVNEIAPRVHNSGHWTMDACTCGQFENHIRAIAGWPLGSTERHSDATMQNLIGDDVAGWREIAGEPGARLHLYGKTEVRPGRKMGHVNRLRPKTAG
jgi:5-(carboxyamino)imidazole ribonucleotide synthase